MDMDYDSEKGQKIEFSGIIWAATTTEEEHAKEFF